MTLEEELRTHCQIAPVTKRADHLEVGDVLVHEEFLESKARDVLVYKVERIERDGDSLSVYARPQSLFPQSVQFDLRADREVVSLFSAGEQLELDFDGGADD